MCNMRIVYGFDIVLILLMAHQIMIKYFDRSTNATQSQGLMVLKWFQVKIQAQIILNFLKAELKCEIRKRYKYEVDRVCAYRLNNRT